MTGIECRQQEWHHLQIEENMLLELLLNGTSDI